MTILINENPAPNSPIFSSSVKNISLDNCELSSTLTINSLLPKINDNNFKSNLTSPINITVTPKRFSDTSFTPIAYKEGFIDGSPRKHDTVFKIIAKYEKLELQTAYAGLTLVEQDEGKWILKDNNPEANGKVFAPEAGKTYLFVRMVNGEIRISTRDKTGHVMLSNNARYVRYAGEVVFDDQQRILNWNNGSNSYLPAPFLHKQAGFGIANSRFTAVLDRNDAILQSRAIFSPRCTTL